MKEKVADNQFFITEDQKEVICKYFKKDPSKIEWWEVMELLDKVIDDLVSAR